MPELTVAQALVGFLAAQQVERDGRRAPFFAGCLGIFGHGNVAGLGEALLSAGERMPYYLARNEQAMVHTAAGFARERLRLATLICTTSVGPGATNLVTGAAAATINRLPVLLLPGEVFATRGPHPVLQQLEQPWAGDVTVNDCLRPVSRYFDRVQRPEQLAGAALEAMRVLTDPAETGAVTLCLPQDVQAEAHDFPAELFEQRVWIVRRRPPEPGALAGAVAMVRAAKRPLIVAGGGVIYSEASAALARLSAQTGIPVAETQAGKGSLPWAEAGSLGGVGATGTLAANRIAARADLVIGIGTRWSDFTTASKTAFAAPGVRFVNVNLAGIDLAKHSALALEADARVALQALGRELAGYRVGDDYSAEIAGLRAAWEGEIERLYGQRRAPLAAQAEIVGAVEAAAEPRDVIVAAAGSLPGDLHKLWRAERPGSYHVEYGYSTMGYEIAGALGVKLASPEREVFALLGDGSYLMLSSELATAVQEGLKLIVVLIDNRGFASIGALSRSVGTDGFGTRYRRRLQGSLSLDGDPEDADALLPIDLAANAESLGARVIRAEGIDALGQALAQARRAEGLVVVSVRADRRAETPSYESWWDVPVAAVSERAEVRVARESYLAALARRRPHLAQSLPDLPRDDE